MNSEWREGMKIILLMMCLIFISCDIEVKHYVIDDIHQSNKIMAGYKIFILHCHKVNETQKNEILTTETYVKNINIGDTIYNCYFTTYKGVRILQGVDINKLNKNCEELQ